MPDIVERRAFFVEEVHKKSGEVDRVHLYALKANDNIITLIKTECIQGTVVSIEDCEGVFRRNVKAHQEYISDNVVILASVEESQDHNNMLCLIHGINNVMAETNSEFNRNIAHTIIVNNNFYIKHLRMFSSMPNVLVLPWFLMSHRYVYPNPVKWNKESGKVLFVPGRLNKVNRICPFYYIEENNWFDNSVYSLTAVSNDRRLPQSEWEQAVYKELKNHITDCKWSIGDFRNFLKQRVCSVDSAVTNIEMRNHPFLKVPTSVIERASVELISETWWQNVYHLTEKTYRSIWCGMPFVHLGVHFTFHVAHSHGFRTFQDFTSKKCNNIRFPQYNSNGNYYSWDKKLIDQHIQHTTEAAYELADLLTKDEEIAQLVENNILFNRKLAMRMSDKYISTLGKIHPGFEKVAEEVFLACGPYRTPAEM
jgi:hypothetical protein